MSKLLTLEACASILGISKQAMYMKIYRGFIPYVKLGSAKKCPIRVEEKELEKYIAQNRVEAFRAKETQ